MESNQEEMSYTFDYESLIRNLKVYSSLESSDKIFISGTNIYIEAIGITSFFSRYVGGQGRELTINYTECLFKEAKRHLNEMVNKLISHEDDIINRFTELQMSIMAALTGVAALKRTYNGDRTTESRLTSVETTMHTEMNTIVRNLICKAYSKSTFH